jgi:hypothetical protein
MARSHAQVKRGRRTLHEGKVVSLRRVKDDVREVTNGLECGILIQGFGEYRVSPWSLAPYSTKPRWIIEVDRSWRL